VRSDLAPPFGHRVAIDSELFGLEEKDPAAHAGNFAQLAADRRRCGGAPRLLLPAALIESVRQRGVAA
jgi:hypothetical protein